MSTFTIFLLGHIVGDFYLQQSHMSEMKKTSYSWLFVHGLIYTLCMAAAMLALRWFGGVTYFHNLLWMGIFTSVFHLVIDFDKKITKLEHTKWGFVIDQTTHIFVIFLAWLLFGRGLVVGGHMYTYARHIATVLGLLCIVRPVGRLLESGSIWDLSMVSTQEQTSLDKTKDLHKNASRLIGYLERIIIFFLLFNGQYIAAALVIAAKFIVKYPEIKNSENKMLANHYIIDTFLNLTAVIAVVVLVTLIS